MATVVFNLHTSIKHKISSKNTEMSINSTYPLSFRRAHQIPDVFQQDLGLLSIYFSPFIFVSHYLPTFPSIFFNLHNFPMKVETKKSG